MVSSISASRFLWRGIFVTKGEKAEARPDCSFSKGKRFFPRDKRSKNKG